MPTDYDEPRLRPEDQPTNESLDAIQAQRSTTTHTSVIDAEDSDTAEGLDLPGAILEEELLVQVVPVQEDEFTCVSCSLVHHRTQLATAVAQKPLLAKTSKMARQGGEGRTLECQGRERSDPSWSDFVSDVPA